MSSDSENDEYEERKLKFWKRLNRFLPHHNDDKEWEYYSRVELEKLIEEIYFHMCYDEEVIEEFGDANEEMLMLSAISKDCLVHFDEAGSVDEDFIRTQLMNLCPKPEPPSEEYIQSMKEKGLDWDTELEREKVSELVNKGNEFPSFTQSEFEKGLQVVAATEQHLKKSFVDGLNWNDPLFSITREDPNSSSDSDIA